MALFRRSILLVPNPESGWYRLIQSLTRVEVASRIDAVNSNTASSCSTNTTSTYKELPPHKLPVTTRGAANLQAFTAGVALLSR